MMLDISGYFDLYCFDNGDITPTGQLVIKTSGVVIIKNNNTFLGECVMLLSTHIQVNERQNLCIFFLLYLM